MGLLHREAVESKLLKEAFSHSGGYETTIDRKGPSVKVGKHILRHLIKVGRAPAGVDESSVN